MNKAHAISDNLNYLMRLLISIALLSSAVAWAAKTERVKTELAMMKKRFYLQGRVKTVNLIDCFHIKRVPVVCLSRTMTTKALLAKVRFDLTPTPK